MHRRELDPALVWVVGTVVLGLSFWHSLGIAHGYYSYYDQGLLGHPGSLIAIVYLCYASLRQSRMIDGLLTGAAAAATWSAPVILLGLGSRGFSWDLVLVLLIVVLIGAGLGWLLSSVAWLARLLSRRVFKQREDFCRPPPAPGRRPAISGPVFFLLALSLLSLLVDSFGWSLERNLFQPLQFWLVDSHRWWGWLEVFRWERTLPVALGGLACWSLLRRKRWAGRATVAYLVLTVVFAIARFAAFSYLRVRDTLPLVSPDGPGPSVHDTAVFSFAVLDEVALVEAVIRAVIAGLGIGIIARSRRLRDWFTPELDFPHSPPPPPSSLPTPVSRSSCVSVVDRPFRAILLPDSCPTIHFVLFVPWW